MSWKKIDLHLHTPASSDYRDPGVTYLDILKKAEEKGLDMIAFADHNTVGGYAAMHREIEILSVLEKRDRLDSTERQTLEEYRRLLKKIVVLPAFEFTATFGFHILGIFPENTSVRKLEYLLLDLNVPEEKMVIGAPDAGSTDDVLKAYRAITAAGGMAIAAHANSSNGVAMQGFPMGGQTKIAYTQDPNLIALEVTDMEATGRRTTAYFFNGTKTEYPRRMHLLQGSDAHSVETEQADAANKRLGVGARITEILVKEASFAALKEILSGTDFGRIRPHRGASAWDFLETARSEGPSMTQSFHERVATKTSRTRPVLHDIVAFSNGEGGTIYIGAGPDQQISPGGVERPEEALRMLKMDIRQTIEPPVDLQFDLKESGDRAIIVVKVPQGDATPYVYTPTGQIYIREDRETVIATRAEIVDLVRRADGVAAPEAAAASPREPRRDQMQRDRVFHPETTEQPAVQAPATQQRNERAERPVRTETPVVPVRAEVNPESRPAPTTPVVRPPAFPNLPPEKIKGQVRPMWPGDSAPVDSDGGTASGTTSEGGDGVSGSVSAAPETSTSDQTGTLAPEVTQAASEAAEGTSRGRRGRRSPSVAATAAPASTSSEEAPQSEEPPARRGRRGRKTEEVSTAEAPTEAPAMEATVASEHKSREELVEEETPKRRRRGHTVKEMTQLEVESPAVAAAATESAMQAMLEEPSPSAPPSRSRRGRKKSEEATAEASTEAPMDSAPVPAAQAEDTSVAKKPRRGTRKKTAEAQILAPTGPSPEPPSMGVEIVDSETRDGMVYHTVRDLRDHKTVHNVTRKSARRLWHYAILQHEHGEPAMSEVMWHPNAPIGLWRRGHRAGVERYDLVTRDGEGKLNVYYGVTEEGLHGPWLELLNEAEIANYFGPEPAD